MIRTIVILLYLAVYLVLGIPASLAAKAAGRDGWEEEAGRAGTFLIRAARGVAFLSGSRASVSGLEHVPADVPVLYICNHRGFFDSVHMLPLMKNPTSILAKKELARIPFLGSWMRLMRCEFLDRKDIRQGLKCILACISHVREGQSVCIFPEGTRSSGDEMKEFKEGSFKVAQKTGCPIIPVAISGTEDVLEEHFPFVRPAPVRISFGEPVYMDQLAEEEKKHIGAYVQSIIAGMLREQAQEKKPVDKAD